MTNPFTLPTTPPNIGPFVPRHDLIYNPPKPRSVFSEHKVQLPTIRAVKVTASSLSDIMLEVLNNSDLAVHIPASRSAIIVGETRFEVGQWMVGEYDNITISHKFRHATQEEVDRYGLA